MKRSLTVLLVMILIAGLPQTDFSQRKTKIKPTRKTSAASEPAWNRAEMFFGRAVKISPATAQLPAEFGGHDFIALFAALEKAVGKLPKDADPERQYQLLKNVKLLGNLTIDDSFVFKVQLNSGVNGHSPDYARMFKAETFQLRQETLIEPDRDMFDGCLAGRDGPAPPTGNSPEDFIKSFKDDAVWVKSHLLLNTVKPIYNRKNYRGKVEADSELPPNCRFKYIVPNPQAQYQLAFTRPQPFDLARSKTAAMSLKDYEYHDRDGIGVIAWQAKGEKNPVAGDDWMTTFFVVKIAPPFLKSETLTDKDQIENKEFKMFARTFYVDIKSLWVVSHKTGKVVKKIGEN